MYIYTNGQAPPSAPATVGEWEYQGCYTDFENQTRTLLRVIELSGPATIETCTAGCKSEGHRFAGLEYGGECWCGDEILSGGPTAESECAMTCAGDRTQICGGPFRLTLYLDTEAPVPEPEEPEEPTPEEPEEPEPEEPTPEEPEPEEPTPEEPEEPEPTPEEPEEPTPEEPEEPEEPAPEEPEPVPEEPEEPVPEDPFPEEPLPTA
ncbi:hypothetical protein CC2G_000065 [Coprinopsis cinerea AmutBmut pab1-1]|nr:hypothetical protein CC2G_000065 [Coprinopsis cinerea AmutBmut pab1-1]